MLLGIFVYLFTLVLRRKPHFRKLLKTPVSGDLKRQSAFQMSFFFFTDIY